MPVTGMVGLDPDAKVSISGVEAFDGALSVALTGLQDGLLPITGSVSLDGLGDGALPITGTVTLETDTTITLSGMVDGSFPVYLSGIDSLDGNLFVQLSGLQDGRLPVTGIVGLDPDATVAISGVETFDGSLSVALSGLQDGLLPITGIVGLDANAAVSLSGLPLHEDGSLAVSLTPLVDGLLAVQISGTPTVLLEEPIDVYLRPVPVTVQTIPLTVLKDEVTETVDLVASNYRQKLTPLTEGFDVRGLSTYTYLVMIEDLFGLENISFVVVEELAYEVEGLKYYTYTHNRSPEHLLPFNGALRLQVTMPDPDAIESRLALMAQIEDLKYRDNASYRHPALVVHEYEMPIQIEAKAYLIVKSEE